MPRTGHPRAAGRQDSQPQTKESPLDDGPWGIFALRAVVLPYQDGIGRGLDYTGAAVCQPAGQAAL